MSTGDIVNNASSPFTFSVSADVHHGAEVKLLLTLSNGAGYNSVGYIGLEVAGKSLSAYGVDVAGNSQDVLTSGQTSTVHIELFNSGSTTALDISGQITSASPAIEILDNNGSWSSVYPGGFSSSAGNGNSFIISAEEDVIPGTIAHLILSINTEDGYSSSSVVPIQIGSQR